MKGSRAGYPALYVIAGVLIGLMCARISGAEAAWALLVIPAGAALAAGVACDMDAF